MEDNKTMELQVSEENDLNEYARIKVENFLNKLSEKLAQKAEREIIKEFVSEQEENGIYHVTVLCYFTDDIMKIMKQLEDKKKWKIIENFRNTKISENSDIAKSGVTLCCSGA